jgi:TetR/AcrR family transcriptional repressor of bet genes
MPRVADHPERRAAFAEAALDAIAADGVEALRLRDVAARADATTGALTHYFDGKDALLQAALDTVMARLLARTAAASFPAEDPAAALDSIALALPLDAQSARDWRVWLAFCGRAVASRDLRAAHTAHYAAIVDALGQHGLAQSDADAVIAAVDGIGLRATLEPQLWPPQRQRDALARLLRPLLA